MRLLHTMKLGTTAMLITAGCLISSQQTMAQAPDGGMVQTENGQTSAEVFINNQPSVLSFDSMGVSGSNFRYIITDANDNVLMVKFQDQQNFNPAGVGECHVWGIAYEGSLQNTSQGTPVRQVSATNADSLSRNFITVTRTATDGGMVQTEKGEDSVEVVIDNQASIVGFDSINVAGDGKG